MTHIRPVIMAGGSGTRCWPASREAVPKQFLRLSSGPGGRTLLEEAVARFATLAPLTDVLVVGAESHAALLAAAAAATGAQVVTEPRARNTAACVGLAACHALACSGAGDPVLVVNPADQFVGDPLGFVECARSACAAAAGGGIAVVGITPTRPETGYGYIEIGDTRAPVTPGVPKVSSVKRFVEKPSQGVALDYLQSGRYLWNAGIFVLRASVALRELERALPETAPMWREVLSAIGTERYAGVVQALYDEIRPVSFDVAVLETTSIAMSVVHGTFAWSDVGSWQALHELKVGDADDAGNVIEGDAVLVGCDGCLIRATSGRTVAALGLTDMVVVDTPDVLMVCPRERSQEVRQLVAALRDRRLDGLL